MVKAVVSSVAPDGVGSTGLSQSEVDARVVAVAGNSLNSFAVQTGEIADDGFWEYDFGTSGIGIVIVTANFTGRNGIFAFRTGSSPFIQSIASNGIATTNGALNGTTGSDNTMTISVHTDGSLYIENRVGGSMFPRVFIVDP